MCLRQWKLTGGLDLRAGAGLEYRALLIGLLPLRTVRLGEDQILVGSDQHKRAQKIGGLRRSGGRGRPSRCRRPSLCSFGACRRRGRSPARPAAQVGHSGRRKAEHPASTRRKSASLAFTSRVASRSSRYRTRALCVPLNGLTFRQAPSECTLSFSNALFSAARSVVHVRLTVARRLRCSSSCSSSASSAGGRYCCFSPGLVLTRGGAFATPSRQSRRFLAVSERLRCRRASGE